MKEGPSFVGDESAIKKWSEGIAGVPSSLQAETCFLKFPPDWLRAGVPACGESKVHWVHAALQPGSGFRRGKPSF